MGRKITIFLMLVFATGKLFGQPTSPSDAKTITVDLAKYTFSAPIPYDKPINLVGIADAAIVSLDLYISEGNFITGQHLPATSFVSSWGKNGSNTFFTLMIDVLKGTKKYLEADHYYALEIIGKNNAGTEVMDFRYMINTTSAPGDQIKMDFGVLYAPGPKMLSGEIAAHIYAVPVNDDADPVNFQGAAQNIFKRTSVYFGLSIARFRSDSKQDVKNFVGLGNLVYGVSVHSPFYGWYGRHQTLRRFLQPMYINFGEILFKQADANPLIVKDRNKRAFYVGLSYDFNFTSLIAPLNKLFSP